MLKIKELHKDIERYLQNDCYCPNEIYSFDGFFYVLYYEEQECEYLGSNDNLVGCIAHPFNDEKRKPEVVLFFINKDDKCYDAIRYDATENNLKITKDILANGIQGRKFKFDEYEKNSTAKSLKEVLSMYTTIMIN